MRRVFCTFGTLYPFRIPALELLSLYTDKSQLVMHFNVLEPLFEEIAHA